MWLSQQVSATGVPLITAGFLLPGAVGRRPMPDTVGIAMSCEMFCASAKALVCRFRSSVVRVSVRCGITGTTPYAPSCVVRL